MRSACRAQGGHSFRLVPQMPCRVGTGPTADARARGRVVANPPMPTRPVRSRPRPPAHPRCEGGLCRQPVTGPAEPVQGDPWRFTGLGVNHRGRHSFGVAAEGVPNRGAHFGAVGGAPSGPRPVGRSSPARPGRTPRAGGATVGVLDIR